MAKIDIKKARADAMATFKKYYPLLETTPGKPMTQKLLADLDAMPDQQFYNFMVALRDGEAYLPYIAPNFEENGISLENNYAIAHKFGISFQEHVILTDPATGLTYMPSHTSFVGMGPVRRQVQTRESGIAVAGPKLSTDDLTDQVAGPSDVSKITAPEIGGLEARDMPATLTELVAVRGGNLTASNTMDRHIIESGEGSLKVAMADGSRAKVSDTMSAYLIGAHIGNNI